VEDRRGYARLVPFREAFPIFHTPDLVLAVAFYTERLGFEEGYRIEGFAVVRLDSFELGLAESTDETPAGRVAIWLYTDDVDAEIERLREAGVEVVKEPKDWEWGERMGSVADPDGNEICLGQRLEAS
jgi:lactoylglutathione lyase